MDSSKVQKILNWPQPKNIKDLQSFLGFANLHCCFIENYSKKITALTSLLKEDSPFIFNEEALSQFQLLKEAFTTAPISSHFNPSLPAHQGKSRVNHWRLTSRHTAWVKSHQRQDNINRHTCHMRMSLKAQTHFNTICNVWVISTHWLLPPQRLACLRACTALHVRLQHCPPSLSSPLLTLSHPFPYHPYARRVPSQHAPNTTYPYACVVPSLHASNKSYHPYARGVPS
ncbi:hypothetical protein O181_131590 [Austropuccinia psidii MF-1]|uniref:Reverse transcriptase/retrotransposon-derived protein RNase H-like domain-containing protein n=1 Tax=Austropuccinia psidii MF-1 TaxID=1389203 RepID=A0A9Q3QC28_9BASI|nr:hypothetical protein [Austropuccinia psidii MF-1]